jgi:hypothetical protein
VLTTEPAEAARFDTEQDAMRSPGNQHPLALMNVVSHPDVST